MIRSCRIPAVLNRICDDNADGIQAALLVTFEGEILGESSTSGSFDNASAFGALVADIAADYTRAGQDYANISSNGAAGAASSSMMTMNNTTSSNNPNTSSKLECLLLEHQDQTVAVAACPSVQCFVVAIASSSNSLQQLGRIKAKLLSLASFVEQSMSTLANATNNSNTNAANNNNAGAAGGSNNAAATVATG